MKTTNVALVALAATCASALPSPKYLAMKASMRPNSASHTRSLPKDLVAELQAVRLAELKTTTTGNDSRADVVAVKAPHENIWASLTSAEAASVVKLLHSKDDLNLTAASDAGSWDNWIGTIDLLKPKKSDALEYAENGGQKPGRYAKAIINFQATTEPYLQEYTIGPLPISNSTTVSPLGRSIRNYDADGDKVYEMIEEYAGEMEDIVQDITGLNLTQIDWWGIDPLWHEEGRVVYWVTAWGIPSTIFGGQTLLPQGIYMRFDITTRNRSEWGLTGVLHNGEFYQTISDFRSAWEKPDFEKVTPNTGVDDTWIGTDPVGDILPLDDRAPPLAVLPGAPRWSVDEEQKYVQWQDFSFYIAFSRDAGVMLHDVTFKGEKIMSSIGLQEAVAHYAGNDPTQSGTSYLDTYYGFGPYTFQLVPGIDCPVYSTMLDTTFHAVEVSTTHPASICIFESDESYPMARHSSATYVTATKNIALKLRSVASVGNYDYSFTYTFFQDGSIETDVKASGYIQSAFYAKNEEYGYQINKGLSGSMHSHVLAFKADLLGPNTTLEMHKVVPREVKYPWSNSTRSTMALERKMVASEDESKLNFNKDTLYLFNTGEKNAYGEKRGWRFMPGRGAGMHLVIQNSENLHKSMAFATHDFYVTKYKDDEEWSAHSSNSYDTRHPILNFAEYFDGESLVEEDLVLWYNLGMHHVPHTGDIPVTVQTTAQASMVFSPHNWLESDPSRQSRQTVRIDYNSSDPNIVENALTFGAAQLSGNLDLGTYQPDYMKYTGDSNIRKLPYDPLNPYNETISI